MIIKNAVPEDNGELAELERLSFPPAEARRVTR